MKLDEDALERLRTAAGDFAAFLFADNLGEPFWFEELKRHFGEMARIYFFEIRPRVRRKR